MHVYTSTHTQIKIKIKKLQDKINSRFNTVEEKISELEGKKVEMIETKSFLLLVVMQLSSIALSRMLKVLNLNSKSTEIRP